MQDDLRPMLTVVVAAFNEAEALPLLQPRIAAALDALRRDAGVEGRVLYVDDGSRDGTWTTLQDIASSDPRVSLLRLSRNFGKELALTAGLDRVVEGAALRSGNGTRTGLSPVPCANGVPKNGNVPFDPRKRKKAAPPMPVAVTHIHMLTTATINVIMPRLFFVIG